MRFLAQQKRYWFCSLDLFASNNKFWIGGEMIEDFESIKNSTVSADRPMFGGLTWEALCRVSTTLAFARCLTNLQMMGFGAPFCCLAGARWAMSDRNTSLPNSWNNFTLRALVSAAVSLIFSGRPIIELVALFLNLVNGVANTCNFSVALIKA